MKLVLTFVTVYTILNNFIKPLGKNAIQIRTTMLNGGF